MNDGVIGITALVTIAAICSIVSHLLIKQFTISVLVSGLVGALLFQFAAYIHHGHVEPFYLFAAFVSFLVSCIISSIIGCFIFKRRNS